MIINEELCRLSANPSPHVKSGIFLGQIKSMWRAMTSPAFDFQGDRHQQGGAIIAGPGKFFYLSFACLWKCSILISHVASLVHKC